MNDDLINKSFDNKVLIFSNFDTQYGIEKLF